MASSKEKTTTHVSLVCQYCTRPIKLNRSLDTKNLITAAEQVENLSRNSADGPERGGEKPPLPPKKPGLRSRAKDVSSKPAKPTSREEGRAIGDGTGEGLGERGKTVSKPIAIPEAAMAGDQASSASIEGAGGGEESDQPSLLRSSKRVRSRLGGRKALSVIYSSLPSASSREDTTLWQIQLASEAFKLLSEGTDTDHPLCYECPEAVLDEYDKRICKAEDACRLYENMLAKLLADQAAQEVDAKQLEADLQELKLEEETLKNKLSQTDERRRQIRLDLEREKEREAGLREEEQEYWSEFNDHQHRMLELQDDQVSVRYQIQYTSDQLDQLKRTNVLNGTFNIWHNGYFGTINGLRLGRLQTVPVEWNEINAAWGQTALLLNTLARIEQLAFERFKLVPYGNQSFLEPLEGKKRFLPLYSSPGLRLFTDNKFDSAMVAFLDCLNQFKDHIESTSRGAFVLPYSIEKDKIGDSKEFFSVRTQFNTMERWTKALKFVLTNLRWALTWCTADSLKSFADK